MAVQIHEELTVDDLFRAADLIGAVLGEIDGKTLGKIQNGEMERHELGRMVVQVGLRVAPESGKRFLAGLVDTDPKDFGSLPMDATLDIVEQLAGREDLSRFFERARSLAGSIGETAAPES